MTEIIGVAAILAVYNKLALPATLTGRPISDVEVGNISSAGFARSLVVKTVAKSLCFFT